MVMPAAAAPEIVPLETERVTVRFVESTSAKGVAEKRRLPATSSVTVKDGGMLEIVGALLESYENLKLVIVVVALPYPESIDHCLSVNLSPAFMFIDLVSFAKPELVSSK